MSTPKVTCFTPVYNRKHTIHRTYDSLVAQTCQDFEWLIIDDGSTDGIGELIEKYKEEASFPIRYYYKENGGKHTAHNMALGLAECEYFLNIDSDDALSPQAVEKSIELWESIPEDKRDEYWCVVGRCIDVKTGEMIGEPFPQDINSADDPHAVAATCSGDKAGCADLKKIKEFPYPEPKGTTFITEAITYIKLDRKYKQLYTNEQLKYVYTNEPDSLCTSWFRDHAEQGYVSNYFWNISLLNDVGIETKSDLKLLIIVPYYGYMAKKNSKEMLKAVENRKYRAAILFALPFAYVLRCYKRLLKK